MAQYVTVTQTDEDLVDHEFLEVQYPDKCGSVEYERSYTCVTCGLDYKKYDIRLVDGVPYCIPGDCYKDATKIYATKGDD